MLAATDAMTRNRGGQTAEDRRFQKGHQAGRGQSPSALALAETDFAPLDGSAERSFGALVGRLRAFVFQESVQPVIVLEQALLRYLRNADRFSEETTRRTGSVWLDMPRTTRQTLRSRRQLHFILAEECP